MKNIFFSLVLIPLLFSCEKTTEDVSRITNYVEITLEGSSTEIVPLGSDYVEPGFTALEGDVEVTENVETSNDIDPSTIGVYEVEYVCVNKDGFPAGTTRTVVVYDPAAPDTDLSGTYSADVVRTESDGSNPRPRTNPMIITKEGPGVFYVDCLLGNYYSIGSGYGPAYAMTGYINLDADNNITLLSSHVTGWGDGLEAFNNGVANADGSVYWESIYAGADIFAVTGTPE